VNSAGPRPAKRESIETILELGEMKRLGTCEKLVVSGCLSQRYAPTLALEMPEVDHFLGTSAYVQLGDLLAADAAPRQLIPDPDYIHTAQTPKVNSSPKYTAYLKISEGCDRLCTYCAIPKMRGKHITKPIEEIIREARELVADGVRELIIVAQDTTYYGMDLYGRTRLADLLRELDRVDGPDKPGS